MAAEAMKRRSEECPPLETLAAYLDGRLNDVERSRVAAHVAECETCYFVFTEAAQMRRTGVPQEIVSTATTKTAGWRSPRVLWSTGGVLAAAATVVLAVGLGWFQTDRAANPPELQALVAAVGAERPVEPRLTGGFAYGTFRGAMRAGDSQGDNISPDVRIAAAQIEKAYAGRRTPQALRALAAAYVVTGNVSRAIPLLEQAVDHPSPDAQALSDLGAAYLVRASRENQPQDVGKALAALDRAIALDPRLGEARFNRALALERLSLASDARYAWRDYLAIDNESPWAAEARRHLNEPKPDKS